MPKKREMSQTAQIKAESALAEKKQRLAVALKENLRRRKVQKRQVQASDLESSS
jgi:hypothetical protein